MDTEKFSDRIYPNYWTVCWLVLGSAVIVVPLCAMVGAYFIYQKLSWDVLLIALYVAVFGALAYFYTISPLLHYFCQITVTDSSLELLYPLKFKRKIIPRTKIRSFEPGTYYFHKKESPSIRIFLVDKNEIELVRMFHRRFGHVQFHLEQWGVKRGEPKEERKLKSKF